MSNHRYVSTIIDELMAVLTKSDVKQFGDIVNSLSPTEAYGVIYCLSDLLFSIKAQCNIVQSSISELDKCIERAIKNATPVSQYFGEGDDNEG